LLKADSGFKVLAECPDGHSAIKAISGHKPDLVFLDVQMPGTDGFGVLEAVVSVHLPSIIFATAHDQYALKAFDAHAVDYLLKPFKRERFFESLAQAKKVILKRGTHEEEKLRALVRHVSDDRGRLVIRTDRKTVFLRSAEVEWIEAAGNYVRIHAGDRTYDVREKISEFEHTLDPARFVRIHRSIIVNLDAIREQQGYGGGEFIVILRNGKELPLGRTYRDTLDNLVKRSP